MTIRISALLAFCFGLAAAARGADSVEDLRVLRAAGVPTEGPALVKWLRSFAPSDVDPASVKTLIVQLGVDEFEERELAVKKLIAMGPRATPYLREALRDPDRERAIRAEHCLKVLDAGPGQDVHSAALSQIAAQKPAGAAAALLEYLPFAPQERLAEDAITALQAVAKVGGSIDPAVVRALQDKAPRRRFAAAEALVKAGAAEHRQEIKKLLADTDATVRLRVGLALIHDKDKDALPVLIELLDQVPPVQRGLIENVLFRLAGAKAPLPSNRATWTTWWKEHHATVDLAKLSAKNALLGFTLVAFADGTLRELDPGGKVRWQIGNLQHPLSLQVLGPDRFLIAEYRGKAVFERNSKGDVLWEYKITLPISGQRLADGNTFIVTRTRFMEVDPKGTLVYTFNAAGLVAGAKKLVNGEILCITSTGSCVRYDATRKEVQRFPVGFGINFGCDFDVTPDGRIFVPVAARNKVAEFNAQGMAVKEFDVVAPDAVTALPSGNILVASQKDRRVVELDQRGQVVWEHRSELNPIRVQRR